MAAPLEGKTVAFLVAPEGFEQIELTEPWKAVQQAEGTARLICTAPGKAHGFNHLDRADDFDVDDTVANVTADDFDALVLPGGVANPDFLRTDRAAVAFVRAFFDSGRPVAVICHGPWTLIEADVLRDRRLTSWPSLQTDIRNAGGEWHDEEVVTCTNGPNTLISSRRPDDLKAFCQTLVTLVEGS
jgi:protease I